MGITKHEFAYVVKDDMDLYAHEVNERRAIPSIYDGLKPSMRRIIYTMIKDTKDYRGCADIVGNCLGRFAPHGDSSCYGALVRLSQPLIMNYPLIDFQGNNGSLVDPPAAYRYTKARLSQYGQALLKDINIAGVVEWQDNYSETEKEPKYLLGDFGPINLLINPNLGIGVGIASLWIGHKIEDIREILFYRMKHPNCTFEELPPLYPSFTQGGGIIINKSDISTIYKTGKGAVVIRAKHFWKNHVMHITEMPYRVSPTIVKKYLINHPIPGMLEVYEGQGGYPLKIYVDKDVDETEFEQILFKKTQLQTTINANMVATDINGKPHLYTLLEILDTAIALQHHRLIKKAENAKATYEHQLHINQGLAKALDVIDEVIGIIRNSDSPILAESNLIDRLGIDNEQAKAILDIRLARLSKMEIDDVRNKIEELTSNIEKEAKIIESSELREEIYQSELNIYTDNSPRTECFDYLTNTNSKYITEPGYISIIDANTYIYSETIEYEDYNISERGNGVPMPVNPSEEYFILTTKGRGIRFTGSKFLKDKNAFSSIISLSEKEYVITIIPKSSLGDDEYLTILGSDNKEYSLHSSFIKLGATIKGKRIFKKKIDIKAVNGFSDSPLYAQLS